MLKWRLRIGGEKILPDDVKFIISTLEAAGYEGFAVGGCVRDVVRGVAPKDWDIATSVAPAQVKALFSRTVDTGIKHGTVTVLLGNAHYEVTTYRIDGEYSDNRHPKSVIFSGNIEEDLSRRDFTMNAIAYNETAGFIDPFGGREDITKGVIRCVGEARHRFSEDALRMLRAVRFGAVTGFIVDCEILDAISDLKQNLSYVSPERIREEMGKLLCGDYPQALRLLNDTGLLQLILQGRKYGIDLEKVVEWLHICPAVEPMRLTLFLEWAGGECEKILRDLRFDNRTIREVGQYVEFLQHDLLCNRYEIKKLLRVLQHEYFENLLILKGIIQPCRQSELDEIRQEACDILEKGECFTLKALDINGNDLAKIGIAQGKTMGDTLEHLLDAVMRDPSIKGQARQLEWVADFMK